MPAGVGIMKHLEQIAEALRGLADRYGITITEVPDRLREKILHITGPECAAEIDLVLQPLRDNLLRQIRVRAGNKVEERVVNSAREATAALDGFSQETARQIVDLWTGIFKVKTVKKLIETAELDEFDRLEAEFTIKDDIKLVTDESVEKVFNPFDSVSKVVEPQVADYDGKFGDGASERVTDFSISDAENQISINVESFDAQPVPLADSRRSRQEAKEKQSKSRRKQGESKPEVEFEMGVAAPPPSTAAVKYTIDDAFKQLRNNNFDLATKIMMELARGGNSKAQFHLGEFYLMGTGVEISEEKAKYWLRKAAAQGSFPAKQKLEDLESNDGTSGCFGCFFTIVVVGGALKLLSVLAGL